METAPKFESPAESLARQLDSVPWEDQYEFTYNGIDFKLHISSLEDISRDPDSYGESAEYARSTVTDGYDIYLLDTIPEVDRKRYLFHEVFEASLSYFDEDVDKAHKAALVEEEKIFGKRQ